MAHYEHCDMYAAIQVADESDDEDEEEILGAIPPPADLRYLHRLAVPALPRVAPRDWREPVHPPRHERTGGLRRLMQRVF